VWLDPDVRIAENHGYSRRELREIERIARDHIEELRYAWDDFCGGPGQPSESDPSHGNG
jgi:hypothetical protein